MAEAEQAVAIIGVAGTFPGAGDADAFWHNVRAGVDAITDATPERSDPEFFDPTSDAVDRVYTRRGGFVGDTVPFDAGAFGIMPVAARGAEPDQLVTLQVAARCLRDAGYDDRPFDRERTGVILGRGGHITSAMARVDRKVRQAEQIAVLLAELAPDLDPAVIAKIKAAFQDAAGDYGPDSAIGLVPNLVASRVANRLDLNGPAYLVDAACASSLIAVEHACRELRSGRCEMVLAGGVHLTQDVTFWSVFVQLGALSHAGTIRPFDRRADGLLIGEGVGVIALKRLDHAERDGDRIYAVIHGVGSASDGRARSVMVPRVAGQVLALRRAWEDAGLDPASLGLLEAHGTGTQAGDRAELETARQFFGPPGDGPRAVIGSVKSMIGHAMPAAGIAGLIKAALAIHHGVLPPSLHCEEPREELLQTRFEVLGAARPWEGRGPRVAGVNAFGFGGIDAHVVLTSHGEAVSHRPARREKPADRADAPVLALAGRDVAAVQALLDAGATRGGTGPCRLAVVDPTPARLDQARRILERGAPWPGRGGIWFRPAGLVGQGGRIAFLFPGIEARFDPEVASVARHLDLPAPPLPDPHDLERTGVGVVLLGLFLDDALRRLGVVPEALAGHSIGEWTGMVASGMLSADAVETVVSGFGAGRVEVPDVLFAAAACGVGPAREAIDGLREITVSHDNCPDQVILCGRAEAIEVARERLVGRGVICQVLPFRSGFHSPLFADYVAPHRRQFDDLPVGPADPPLWSATTCAPYPADPAAVRTLAVEHLVAPLRFRELVENLYAEGFRAFVQVGTGSLVGFVDNTLGDRPHVAVSASVARRSGLAQLRNLLLALFVEGAEVDLDRVVPPPGGPIVPLQLGSPLVRLDPSLRGVLSAGVAAPAVPSSDDPVLVELGRTMEALTRAGQDVVQALQQRAERAPRTWSETRVLSVDTVPALRDHGLFPQPEGWSCLADISPVVPMTMTLELLLDAARSLRPGRVAVEVAKLEAQRWLGVEPPVEVTIRAERASGEWVHAEIEGFARARIRMAERFPPAPTTQMTPLAGERPAPIDASRLYTDRLMFHGPRYQGVVGLGPIGDDGIEGMIVAPGAPGALIDNAGQVFGSWAMLTQDQDRLSLPLGVDGLWLYGPQPPPGARVACRARITQCDERHIVADLELEHEGRIWCRIRGWDDRRFVTGSRVWPVMRLPEHNLLSDPRGPWVRYDPDSLRSPSRDWMGRRYLGQAEREAMLAAGPGAQRAFLDDRIAAKDALRHLLWRNGQFPLFPVELPLVGDSAGGLVLRALPERDLRVAAAHLDHVSVAIAAEGQPAGIAIARAAFDDEGARVAVAMQAAARARGTAPGSDPGQVVVEQVSPDHLVVDGTPVAVAADGPHLVAWTPP